ncbi:MAG: DUF362 domain-containing protein [Phycisphaeraceae bacterium]|nr:DUF362 domain-containing protein [Phycisphaeraceae bacterium]
MEVNRRDFLRQVAAWSAGLSAAAPILHLPLSALGQDETAAATQPSAAKTGPIVAVAKGKDYAELVTRVLKPLGGIESFVKPGQRVVVKPNIGWDRTPAQAANTHPDVVKAVVQLALAAGAKQVLVFDRPCNEPTMTYRHSGIQPAVESLGDSRAVCQLLDERKFVPVKIAKGQSLDEWLFYRDALEADCYINVPIAKHHGLAKLTLGLKNCMGVIGGNRGQIHQNIGQKLADLNTVLNPKLTIIDATRILLANGPSGGNIEDVKILDTLIASTDMVAADAYATTLFGLRPEQISSTVAAYRMGLGEMDLKKMQMVEV